MKTLQDPEPEIWASSAGSKPLSPQSTYHSRAEQSFALCLSSFLHLIAQIIHIRPLPVLRLVTIPPELITPKHCCSLLNSAVDPADLNFALSDELQPLFPISTMTILCYLAFDLVNLIFMSLMVWISRSRASSMFILLVTQSASLISTVVFGTKLMTNPASSKVAVRAPLSFLHSLSSLPVLIKHAHSLYHEWF